MKLPVHYSKTEMTATIMQTRPSRCTIERRIYRNESGDEFVRVNGCWINLEAYKNDWHYEVRRWYNP